MEIRMAGIDHSKAGLEYREIFSFTKSALAAALKQIKSEYPSMGCVILSTCNRTEIWLSGGEVSPLELLCRVKQVESGQYQEYFRCREGEEAVHYLMELACGLKSQIFGEDQILTQIKDAIAFARECKSADTVLEILFRDAVTAAKKVKSSVRLTAVNRSMAVGTIELLEQKMGSLRGKQCMVIGNGEMGRLAASALVEQGCHVVMTLRQYKTRDAVIPAGCRVVDYEERIQKLPQMDIVLSATLSPHYTVKQEDLENVELAHKVVLVDLAVPRDIDPKLKQHPMLQVYDVDSLGGSLRQEDLAQIEKAKELLREYETEFENWYYFREWIPMVQKIGKQTAEDVVWRSQKQIKKLPLTGEETGKLAGSIGASTQKSVSKLLYGLREYLDKDQFESCMRALEKASNQR
ncbi:MAG: glutamyl-tRNA reductase [Massiliimalia sp.]